MTPATTCGTCGVLLPPDAAEQGVLTCPKCIQAKRQVAPTVTGSPATPPAPPINDPYQQFTVFDEQTEWIYDGEELTSGTRYQELPVDANKVAVPRKVIYLQGILLSLVAISCFSLGMLVGQQNSALPSRSASSQPCLIQGLVSYTSNSGQRMPDDRAVIIAIPETLKLDEKLNHRELGVTEHPPDANRHPDVLLLRSSGGNHTWSNARGEYRIQLRQTGDYFFLFLSRHHPRPG
ncbi:MAG: hypothetical protein MK364_01665, partial [Pirellulales bacterium]|nr:hypothetical protein [Pirellulales bacterium]